MHDRVVLGLNSHNMTVSPFSSPLGQTSSVGYTDYTWKKYPLDRAKILRSPLSLFPTEFYIRPCHIIFISLLLPVSYHNYFLSLDEFDKTNVGIFMRQILFQTNIYA